MIDTSNLTEYQKTLLEIYQREGENALRQYFRKHEKAPNEDVVEQKLEDFLSLLDKEDIQSELLADGKKNMELDSEEETVLVDEVLEQPTVEIETHIVTMGDGSVHEIQTANGVVINPIIPVIDLQSAAEETDKRDSVLPPDEIKSQEESGKEDS